CLDAGDQVRRTSQGCVQQCCQDRFHDRRIDLALTPHKGAKVLATLPKIFEMLAGCLPVGTAHKRGELLQRMFTPPNYGQGTVTLGLRGSYRQRHVGTTFWVS